MSSADTVKTTVRLPADLHWQFQGERAKRRLSNEKAICEAFALWIANPAPHRRRKLAGGAQSHDPADVGHLLDMLRDFQNRVEQLHKHGNTAEGRRGRSPASAK